MSSIEIFNPNEKPYGLLSNNAKHNMVINKELWTSVTQFIYSNMINNYVYRDSIKKRSMKNIYYEYNKYQKQVEDDIVSSSLEEAIRVKFENPELLNILLSTGDSDIIYVSPNSFLGIGADKRGYNIVGKYLVQFRNEIVNTKIRSEKDLEQRNQLYEAFIIYNFLKNSILKGDDLSDYLYLKSGPQKIFDIHLVNKLNDILNIYTQKNPDYRLIYEQLLDNANKAFFLNLYERNDPELFPLLTYSLRNPSAIILYLRKKYLGNIKTNQEIIKYNNVFRMYLENVLETKYKDIKPEDYDTVINNEFGKKQFVEDPQYIIEKNIINEKKKLLDSKIIQEEVNEQDDSDKNENLKLIKKYADEIEEIIKTIPDIQIELENTKKIYKDEMKENDDLQAKLKQINYNINKIKVSKKFKEYEKDLKFKEKLETEKNETEDILKKTSDKAKKIDLEKKINEIIYKIDELKALMKIIEKENENREEEKLELETEKTELETVLQNFKNKIYDSSTLQKQKNIKELVNKLTKIIILEDDSDIEKQSKKTEKHNLKNSIDTMKDSIITINLQKIKKLENQLQELQNQIKEMKDKIYGLKTLNYNYPTNKDMDSTVEEIRILEEKLNLYKKVAININYNELKKRIFFIRNELDPVLVEKINTFLSTLKIPTEEEVAFSKTFDLNVYGQNYDPDNLLDIKPIIKVKNEIRVYQGNPSNDYIPDLELIKRNSYQLLSPVYYTGMLRIKNFDYPTVTHYIIANLFANIPIIKKDIDEIFQEYEKTRLVIIQQEDEITQLRLDIKKLKNDENLEALESKKKNLLELNYILNNKKQYLYKIYDKIVEDKDIDEEGRLAFDKNKIINLKSMFENKKEYLNKIYKETFKVGGNLKEAQQYMLKDPSGNNWNRNTPSNWIDYKTLYDKYLIVSTNTEEDRLKDLAIIGLNKKFEDRVLQNLLISTENKNILWSDTKDNILGIGKNKNGANFIGNYLMTLRNEIFTEQNTENIEVLTEENVTNIIKSDEFMNNWMEMKVKDMCNVVRKVKEYCNRKYNIDIENNKLFFTIVLNKIFQPCSELFILSKKVNTDVPLYFVRIVNKYIKNKYSPSIIELLWKRIVVMVYYIIKNVKEPTLYNIKNILIKIEFLLSQETNCLSIIQDDEESNCIFSALINILLGIVEYNKEYNKLKNELVVSKFTVYDEKTKTSYPSDEARSVNPLINKFDIELAMSIILNSRNIIQLEEHNKYNKKDLVYQEDVIYQEEDEVEDNKQGINYEEQKDDNLDDDNLDDEKSNVSDDDYIDDVLSENEDNDSGGDYRKRIHKKEAIEQWGEDYYNKEEEQMYYYYKTLLKEYLQNNNIFENRNNLNIISDYIANAANVIKNYTKISEKIKNNRINFFATIR